MNKIFLLIVIALFFSACADKSEQEKEDLQAYLTTNNITTEPTASGMYYIETLEGTSRLAEAGDVVRVHYTGKLLNGDVFDSSEGRDPIEFTLGAGRVIPGWDEGIAYMKTGGKATLIIPSDLAYGAQGSGTIPGYSTLVFDVELVEIVSSK